MKAIITADVQLHPRRICSLDGGQDRLEDGLSALRQTLAYAREREVPWVHLGDLKEQKDRWLLSVLNGVRQVFAGFPEVPKVLLHGQHDGTARGESGLWALESEMVTVVGSPEVWPVTQFNLEPVAFWPHQYTVDKLPQLRDASYAAGARVVLGHALLSGSQVGPADVRLDKGLSLEAFGLAGKKSVFRWGFFGDVHKGQSLGKGKVVVPGSPYALTWGELEPDKGCLYVDTDAGVVERLPVDAPRFRRVDWTQQAIPERLEDGCWAGDFVELKVPEALPWSAVEEIRDRCGARHFSCLVVRKPRTARRTESVRAGMPSRDLLQGYLAERPPDADLVPAAMLKAGLKLMEES